MKTIFIYLLITTAFAMQAIGQINWTKDTLNNPVFPRGTTGHWDDQLVLNPYVMYDGNVYHMWYSGFGGGSDGAKIGHAYSTDGGISWTRNQSPVLEGGDPGSWDAATAFQPCVLKDDTTYRMWYCGHDGNLDNRQIGYATRSESTDWLKDNNPILTPGPTGSWDNLFVESPEVLFIDGVYHMWYDGSDGTYIQIGHATSLDGIAWMKDTLNPVLKVGKTGDWDSIEVSQPSVVFDGVKYHMWYSGGTAGGWDWKTGYAYSLDGINWIKISLNKPVMGLGDQGSWDDTFAGLCSVIFNNVESKFKMWYGGGNGIVVGDIGYATATVNPNVINVPGDAPTIQDGIDIANDGNIVLVWPGNYVENINFNGKKIVVGSLFLTTGDTNLISQTVINGSQPSNSDSGSVVYFVSGEDSNSVLSGFKITGGTGTVIYGGGNTTQTHGGGIFLDNSSSPIISNLIVSDNVAESSNGAGIRSWNNSNPRIENVTVIGNDGSGNAETNDGSGGISLENSSPILINVKIVNNIGLMSGGMYCANNSNPVLINVTISGNHASGSVLWNDVAELVSSGGSNPVLINTIVWNDALTKILLRDNSAAIVAYSDIQNGLDSILTFGNNIVYWLEGNIASNPLFADPKEGDYSLQEGSPCIDAGIQDTVLLYNGYYGIYIPALTFSGNAPDMGAQEFITTVGIRQTVTSINNFELYQNYPNPFNPTTKIRYQIQRRGHVSLRIYNILGQIVETLVNEEKRAGTYELTWNAENLSSGIYFYRLQTSKYAETKKMILLK